MTEKSHTDRNLDTLPRRNKVEEESSSQSQLVYKPQNRFSSPLKPSSHSFVTKFDYRVGEKSRREEKGEDPYQKRIQYLKSLIDDKGPSKVGA